jgi:hypothetical protein
MPAGCLPHAVNSRVSAFLKKTTTFRQLQELKRQGFDIYVNRASGRLIVAFRRG